MKIRIRINSRIPGWLGANATTLYPFIFMDLDKFPGPDNVLLRHEMVHCRQVRKLGWFKFYISYLLEYLKYRYFGMKAEAAYREVSFEIEAYAMQDQVKLTSEEVQEIYGI